jgi:hypothetical protein
MAGLATANSAQYTKYAAGGLSNLVTRAWNVPIMAMVGEYTVTDSLLDDTAVVTMGRLPKGARIMGFTFASTQLDGATTMTVRVGDGTTQTAITTTNSITDLSHATARQFILPAVATYMNTALTAESIVDVLLAGADVAAASEGDKFTLVVFYLME